MELVLVITPEVECLAVLLWKEFCKLLSDEELGFLILIVSLPHWVDHLQSLVQIKNFFPVGFRVHSLRGKVKFRIYNAINGGVGSFLTALYWKNETFLVFVLAHELSKVLALLTCAMRARVSMVHFESGSSSNSCRQLSISSTSSWRVASSSVACGDVTSLET